MEKSIVLTNLPSYLEARSTRRRKLYFACKAAILFHNLYIPIDTISYFAHIYFFKRKKEAKKENHPPRSRLLARTPPLKGGLISRAEYGPDKGK
jgi:hypothetical protein